MAWLVDMLDLFVSKPSDLMLKPLAVRQWALGARGDWLVLRMAGSMFIII
jgi:hypothetical protein